MTPADCFAAFQLAATAYVMLGAGVIVLAIAIVAWEWIRGGDGALYFVAATLAGLGVFLVVFDLGTAVAPKSAPHARAACLVEGER